MIAKPTLISIPTLVRVKPGALNRLGIYLRRAGHGRVAVLSSGGLPPAIVDALVASLRAENVETALHREVENAAFETATALFRDLPSRLDAVVGLGGGKALDVAKYTAFLARKPYYAVPCSLSNDGFCSPQASLTIDGHRRSLAAALPHGVVIDTAVCRAAPRALWLSGVGDLAAKLTAVHDWKLAFHHHGEPVNDLAALLSDASVYQFLSRPAQDEASLALLATALLLNGIAMEICGSSRPASGSEHLISHALDALAPRPRLHGLQVGVATYLCSRLQEQNVAQLTRLYDNTGFWDEIARDPFSRSDWLAAARLAPTLKDNYYTVLSSRDCLPEIAVLLTTDPHLQRCFVD